MCERAMITALTAGVKAFSGDAAGFEQAAAQGSA
jgi:hypothetical protein